MGYYTFHELSFAKKQKGKSEAEHEWYWLSPDAKHGIKEISEANRIITNDLEELAGFWPGDEDTKWYDSDAQMTELSRFHPEYVFRVFGDGEGSDDKWYSYYWNGRKQHCPAIVTYDEMDFKRFKFNY